MYLSLSCHRLIKQCPSTNIYKKISSHTSSSHNIYSDLLHSALKYLKDTKINIHNNLWDFSYPYHSSISNDLLIIADSFNLDLSFSTNYIPTRYSDNKNGSNLVIDLMFLHSSSNKLDCHLIHLE